MSKIITLTTDFGYRDPYVGTMKGVILSRYAEAAIVDLTHGIIPHSVLEASFVLRGSYSFFPEDTVHVVVVDPGVGGTRRILYLENHGHRFLAPDNGVLTGVLEGADRIVSVENRDLFLESVSSTFQGRDVFAPLAAGLCAGMDPSSMGPAVDDPVILHWPEPDVDQECVEGCVLYIDVFGNLVTNIESAHLDGLGPSPRVFLKGDAVGEPRRTYVEMEKGKPLALINSFDLLEIAVREGSAARLFGAGTGDEVTVTAT
jgi:S-adenosylmethionine hydrolase